MAGNYAQLLDIINNPTQHGLPAWDNNAKQIEGETIQQYLLYLIQSLTVGFQFMGVASTNTNGGTPDQNVFYLAGAGTYNGFGSNPITIDAGYIGVIMWNGAWFTSSIKIADIISISQNTDTGHTDINIGTSKYPVASLVDILKSTDLHFQWDVTVGGSNSRQFPLVLQKGDYGFILENIAGNNTSTFSIYVQPNWGNIKLVKIGTEVVLHIDSDNTQVNIGDFSAITESGTLRLTIRDITSNKSIIDKRDDYDKNLSPKFYSRFVNSALTNGVLNTYHRLYRAASLDIMKYDRDIFIVPNNGYRFEVFYFDENGNYTSSSGWQTSKFRVEKGTYFKVCLNTIADNANVSPSELLENITISTIVQPYYPMDVNIIGKGSTGVVYNLPLTNSKYFKLKLKEWSISNVGSTGNNILSVFYIKDDIGVDLQNFSVQKVASEGFPDEIFIKLPDFPVDRWGVFVRADNNTIASMHIEEYIPLTCIESKKSYTGKRINPNMRYAMTELGKWTSFGTPVDTYAQSMTVFDNRYIIQGCNKVGVGSHIVIIDLLEKSLHTITYEVLTEGQGFHMEGFGLGQKYADTDTLPLLYMSEAYNDRTCKVVRIANDFESFTLIQTISYSGSIQGAFCWLVDDTKNYIYIHQVATNGDVTLTKFELPSITNDVTLTDDDIIATYNIPNTTGLQILIGQGSLIKNGKFYMPFGLDTTTYPNIFIVADIEKEQMESFVDISGLGEVEGVASYLDGLLFVFQYGLVKSGGSLSNPAYIYMLFNI